MKLKELIQSISRNEWLIVAAFSVLVMVITAIPPVFGYLNGVQRGLEWTGVQFFAPGDFGVYLSYIEQGRDGMPYMKNVFTTEAAYPVFRPFWFSVGQLAKLAGLSAVAAFHTARLALIPLLLAVTYLAISFFLPKKRDRLAASGILAFGSGLGLYFAPFFADVPSSLSGHEWPIDLWVAESNLFSSMSYSPHFVVSWMLLILAALLMVMSIEGRNIRYGALAGTAGLLLFSFHPFHAPTLFALGFIYLLVAGKFKKKSDLRSWLAYLVFALMSGPAVLYHYLIIRYGDFGQQALDANVCLTPSFWHVIIGFGVVAVAAPFGWWMSKKGKCEIRHVAFLAVWVIVGIALLYSPLTFQRRLLEGLQFPLVLLAVPAIVATYDRLKKSWPFHLPLAMAMMFVVLFLPSSFSAISRNLLVTAENKPPIFYMTEDERAAIEWIEENTSGDSSFLASMSSGYLIAGWSYRHVYVGHWVNSGDIIGKQSDVRRFFTEMDDKERKTFMLGNVLDYVWYGPDEAVIGEFIPGDIFEEVFVSGTTRVYRLK
jgi:hypothetical protein